jgi:DNA topoisomerase-2
VTENSKKSSTKITFKPDLARFGMEKLDTDIVALMTKRVYDVAGCNPTVKVYLNDERIMLKYEFNSIVNDKESL